jgi:hypothetical protein
MPKIPPQLAECKQKQPITVNSCFFVSVATVNHFGKMWAFVNTLARKSWWPPLLPMGLHGGHGGPEITPSTGVQVLMSVANKSPMGPKEKPPIAAWPYNDAKGPTKCGALSWKYGTSQWMLQLRRKWPTASIPPQGKANFNGLSN